MNAGSANADWTPPILVLGLGNILLGDDGAGPLLVEELRGSCGDHDGMVEFLDGGTQGLALLGRLCDRYAVLILDAVSLGRPPGSVHLLGSEEVLGLGMNRSTTSHEGNAGELLSAAAILGDLPERLYLVGIEPAEVNTRIGLSQHVQRSLHSAREKAQDVIGLLLQEIGEPVKL